MLTIHLSVKMVIILVKSNQVCQRLAKECVKRQIIIKSLKRKVTYAMFFCALETVSAARACALLSDECQR